MPKRAFRTVLRIYVHDGAATRTLPVFDAVAIVRRREAVLSQDAFGLVDLRDVLISPVHRSALLPVEDLLNVFLAVFVGGPHLARATVLEGVRADVLGIDLLGTAGDPLELLVNAVWVQVLGGIVLWTDPVEERSLGIVGQLVLR
jgi:hypothetical protein